MGNVQISQYVPFARRLVPHEFAVPPAKVHSNFMAPSTLEHRRTHNLLLISKLLDQRDAASPFTLVLDSLEQSAKPLVADYIRRANVATTPSVRSWH